MFFIHNNKHNIDFLMRLHFEMNSVNTNTGKPFVALFFLLAGLDESKKAVGNVHLYLFLDNSKMMITFVCFGNFFVFDKLCLIHGNHIMTTFIYLEHSKCSIEKPEYGTFNRLENLHSIRMVWRSTHSNAGNCATLLPCLSPQSHSRALSQLKNSIHTRTHSILLTQPFHFYATNNNNKNMLISFFIHVFFTFYFSVCYCFQFAGSICFVIGLCGVFSFSYKSVTK